MSQRCVTVLGMHRSGTSMVCDVLSQLGVNMGQPHPLNIRWDSPLGQYEDLEFVRLDDEILAAAGGSWDKPPTVEDVLKQEPKFAARIQALIASKESPIWGWKTARNIFTLDLYLPFLPDLSTVVVRRYNGAVCRSLVMRNGMSESDAYALYDLYDTQLSAICSKWKPVEYHYEDIPLSRTRFVDDMTDRLGLQVTSDQRNRAIEHILPHRAVVELREQMQRYDDIKLDVGCGSVDKDGWVGIDIRPLPNVDVVWDLQKFPWPLANNCCSAINCSQVFELIEPKYRIQFMDEMWRLLKPGCYATIDAPHARVRGAYQDPLHYGCPNEVTFWYFDPRHPRYNEYNPLPWTVTEQIMASDNVVVTMTPNKGG